MTKNKFLFRLIIIIGIQISLLPLCKAANSPRKIADCYKASKVYDWKKSTPSKQGMNPNILSKAFEEAHNKTYYFSLLVVRNGYLIAEEYYNERDKYTMDGMYSVTKSFISALIGMAIQKGFIKDKNQKLIDFFPEYLNDKLDKRKKEITILQLLTMCAGFDEEKNISKEMNSSSNMIKAIIGSKLRYNPRTKFLYSTHSSHLLSGIITKATKQKTHNFAKKMLFKPLGINSVGWATDQNDITYGGAGMYLSPRDMARFGYLFLKNGKLGRRQIVPANWVRESIRNYRSYVAPWHEMDDVGYGYQWWTGKFDDYPVYFASGMGGQWILNIPNLNMVIVATMNRMTETKYKQMESLISIVDKYIIPSVIKKGNDGE